MSGPLTPGLAVSTGLAATRGPVRRLMSAGRAGLAHHDSRGQGLVEFALIFPVLMLLLLSMFDAGRLVFAYNDITNAARTGARVAIVNQGGTTAADATIAAATSLGLSSSDVTVRYLEPDLSAPCPTPYDLGCVAEVEVSFDWQAITPLIGNAIGPVTVTTQTRMPIERVFP